MMFISYNPNPQANYVGDCVIRAISKVTNQDWDDTYINVCIQGFMLKDILPAYDKYIDTKRRYQQYEVVDKMLIYAMDNLCTEIVEFISDLYHNTETEAERALIVEMINNMRGAI